MRSSKVWLVAAVFFVSIGVKAESRDLRDSAVCIRKIIPKLEGTNIVEYHMDASAWFYQSGRYLITALHVIKVMELSAERWQEMEIYQHDARGEWSFTARLPMRVLYEHPIASDGVSILVLPCAIEWAKALPIRPDPVIEGEWLEAVGFFGKEAHYSKGRFICDELNPTGMKTGYILVEMRNEEDAIALDAGSYGGPIIDSCGEVVAVVTTSMSLTLSSMDGSISFRIPAPRGSPTNKGVPLTGLSHFRIMDADQ